jgi:hypothetical protein
MATKDNYISKDVLWKGLVYDLFDEFLAFYFPAYVAEVDFSQKPVFLDKELAEISPLSDAGEHRADMLVKVFLKDGTEKWLLIHIEIQGYEDKEFEQRMFHYYYRIWDKYQKSIASIAIFTDEKADYHPKKYEFATWDTHLSYKFTTYKILDAKQADLDKMNNPFALVTEVVLLAIQQKKEDELVVLELKTALFRKLLEKGYDKNYIRILGRFLEYYKTFRNLALNSQFKKNMDNITTLLSNPYPQTMDEFILMDIERQGIIEGLTKGKLEGELKAKEETALNMLKYTKMTIEEIAFITQLPKERIAELKETVKTDVLVYKETKSTFQSFMENVKAKWTQWFSRNK